MNSILSQSFEAFYAKPGRLQLFGFNYFLNSIHGTSQNSGAFMILTISKISKSIEKSYSLFMTSDNTPLLQIECLKPPLVLSHFLEMGFLIAF